MNHDEEAKMLENLLRKQPTGNIIFIIGLSARILAEREIEKGMSNDKVQSKGM